MKGQDCNLGSRFMSRAISQREVVRFLGRAENWPGDVRRVEHLETHISHVFLGGGLALKMKKAVALPYVDFSALERREAMCRRELEINRAFSPGLYLGLSHVARQKDGRLALDGQGEVVEWLVRMRRFKTDQVLAARLARQAPDEDLIRALAAMAADAHRVAEIHRETSGRAIMARTIAELRDALTREDAGLERARTGDFLHHLDGLLAAHGDLLDARAKAGFVRRCHGDMHSGNIVLWNDRPMLFDALEFSEELATVDILHDFAFLLMDLVHMGHGAGANRLMNLWLQLRNEEADFAAMGLMGLFCACRAAIRAMVLLDLARQGSAEKAKALRLAALAYLDTALPCASAGRARIIAVGGLSGSGKTTLAAALAARTGAGPGAVHLRSDVERKLMAGVDEFTRLGAEHYTQAASDAVYARLIRKARLVAQSGWPVVVDAVFSRPDERRAIARAAQAAGADFTGLWLDAPAEILRQRVGARRHDASDATADIVDLQLARGTGEIGWRKLDASGPPRATLRAALALIAP